MITKKNGWLYTGLVAVLLYVNACTLDEENTIPIQAAVSPDTTSESVYQFLVAEAHYYNGEDAQAADYYLSAMKNTQDSYIAERAVALSIQAKKYEQALIAAAAWQKFEPSSTDLNQYLVLLYQETNQPEKAAKALNVLTKALNSKAKPGLDVGMALLGQHSDKKQTYSILKKYAATYDNSIEAGYYQALLAHQAGLHQDALLTVDKILSRKETDKADKQETIQKTLLLKVGVLMKLGKDEQAVNVLNELIHQAAGTKTKQNYARLMASLGKPAQAVQLLQQVYKEQPDNVALLRDIIAIQFDNKEYKATLPLIDDLAKKKDQMVVAAYFRGMAFEALEQYDKAVKAYQAIQHDEDNAISAIDIQRRIAGVLEKHKGFDYAITYIRKQQKKAQTDKPFLAQLYLLESHVYHTAKQYKKAIAANQQAAASLPKNSDILYSQALLYEEMDDLPSSEKVLKSILVFDKNNSNALNALGYLLTDQTTRFDEALTYIQAAYRLQPNDPMIIDSLGWVYFKLGEISVAEKHLREAYEISPEVEIAAHLIELLAKKGEQEEAQTLLQKMLKSNPEAEALLRVQQKL